MAQPYEETSLGTLKPYEESPLKGIQLGSKSKKKENAGISLNDATSSDTTSEKVLLKGYLIKAPPKGMLKSAKRRYFVFVDRTTSTYLRLAYYENQEAFIKGKRPIKTISFSDCYKIG